MKQKLDSGLGVPLAKPRVALSATSPRADYRAVGFPLQSLTQNAQHIPKTMALFKAALLASAIVLIIGCGASRPTSRPGENSGFDLSSTFSSSAHGFSIKYPGTWKSYPTGNVNYVMLGGPEIDSALFKLDGAFAIKIFKLPDSYNYRSAYEENMKSMKEDSAVKDFKIISEEEVLLDGKKAIRVMFTATVGVQMTSLQYYLAVGKKLYTLGGSVPMEELGKYDELYSAIANTFDLD